jgi:hypothetical protein
MTFPQEKQRTGMIYRQCQYTDEYEQENIRLPVLAMMSVNGR